MKYVAYIFEDHKHKNALITLVPNINSFIVLFHNNITLAKYILTKRMYKLLELPINILSKFSNKELQKLQKIYSLMKYASIDNIILVILSCNIDKVTRYNINDIIKFIYEYKDIINGKIKVSWGKGNHVNTMSNIFEHFIKHVKDESEKVYWEKELQDVTPLSYKSYVEDIFLKIEKIVIHSNGKNTYLSGFYGNFFVVGRYNNDRFCISSSYYVESGEKLGRYVDKCINTDKL